MMGATRVSFALQEKYGKPHRQLLTRRSDHLDCIRSYQACHREQFLSSPQEVQFSLSKRLAFPFSDLGN